MQDERPECYISGQITGLDEEEYKENFDRAGELVEKHGFKAVSPLDVDCKCEQGCQSGLTFSNGDYQHSWQCYMKYDIIMLLNCDAIFIQDNAHNSKGATLEIEIASRLGLRLLYSPDGKTLEMRGA